MWHISIYGILVHPAEARVWLKQSSGGFELPGFDHTHDEDPYLGNQFDGALMPGYREALGCKLFLLGNLDEWKDSEAQLVKLVCALEIREGEPSNGCWVDLETASCGTFVVREHLELVERTLTSLVEGEGRDSKVLNRRGHLGKAVAWIKGELPRLGLGSVEAIEQKRSCILRAETKSGVYYFKSPVDVWKVNEPVVADLLGRRYPDLVPKPVCIDERKCWMLTPEFGNTLEHAEANGELLVEFADEYGKMQLDASKHTNEMGEFVKRDFELEQLPTAVEAYIYGDRVSQMLESSEVSELRDALPRLRENIAELREGPVPQSIVHGDLGPYNLAVREGKPIVYDWSTAGIGFPFFDMVELLHRVRPWGAGGNASVRTPKVDDIKARIKKAYLDAWISCSSPSEIERLWRLAEPVGFLSMGLHLPFPYFPRRVLQYMRGLS